jgi:DNA-directed RNA polymerase specialized sigma subunit
LENEKRIVQLKNESLRNEVKLKSKQLANTALALVKKNETLQDIKKELAMNKEGFGNQYAFKKILKKVDSSIAHKDEWKVFEYNFNQVHEDFFMSLKAKHENLTSKDLKICAYIKMNLSNKEIAPLLNVSVSHYLQNLE